jgi:DNA-binding transcriptional ArsR family regulator
VAGLWRNTTLGAVSALTGKSPLAYARTVDEDVFKALADPTRRTILDELTGRDGQTLFEICGRLVTNHGLSSSRQAISQHLAVLQEAGLIEIRRDGRYKFHYINTEPLKPLRTRWVPNAMSSGPRTQSDSDTARRKENQ